MTNEIGRVAMLTMAAALVASGGACADATPAKQQPPAKAASVKPAEATARDFYGWYVGLMAHDKEPSDDAASYARYVTKSLRASIARSMASPDGMDVDYFIKTQDYLDEWVGHVAATPAVMRGSAGRTTVTLGSGGKAWKLAVSLIREDGVWKISGVTRT